MPESLTHKIYYPDGATVPNVPVAMQRTAESADRAIARVSEAPFIVCTKSAAQSMGSTATEVRWDIETWKQGIEHDPSAAGNSSGLFVPLEDGLYSVNARLVYRGGSGTTVGGVVINVNGVNRPNTWVDAEATGNRAPKPTSITDMTLKAGDVVRVMAVGAVAGTEILSTECYLSIRKSAGFTEGAR